MWSKERGLCQLGNKSDVSLTRTYKKYKSNKDRVCFLSIKKALNGKFTSVKHITDPFMRICVSMQNRLDCLFLPPTKLVANLDIK